MKKIVSVIISCLVVLMISATLTVGAVMTPFESLSDTNDYFNGATYILPDKNSELGDVIASELKEMKTEYNINTVSLYAIESFDEKGSNKNKDILFSELKRLNMKAVIRIENYNAAEFTFEEKDIDYILEYYKELISYVSSEKIRDQVAYFALNMPVDDSIVQKNLGGINSEKYLKNQVGYAESFVKRMRNITQEYGFNDAKMFLSVFYGWDNSYNIPSYTSANADGYFINNYSYPKNQNKISDYNSSNDDLINADGLKKGIEKYSSQYGGSPLVVEFGFHTVEYNDGVISDQTAGLVADRKAKEKALKATKEFYSNFPFVKGIMYFGFNLYKAEGSNGLQLDWALRDSFTQTLKISNATLSDGAKLVKDGASKQEKVALLSKDGATLYYAKCSGFSQLGISLKADNDTTLLLYAGDTLKSTIAVKKSEAFNTVYINPTVMADSPIKLIKNGNEALYIEELILYGKIETENAILEKSGKVSDKNASQGYCTSMVKNTALTLHNVRGGSKITLCYKAAKGAKLLFKNNNTTNEITLPATKDYTEITFNVNVSADSSIKIENIGDDIRLDYLRIGGIGKVTVIENEEENSGSISKIMLIVSTLVLLFSIVLAVFFICKIKKIKGNI